MSNQSIPKIDMERQRLRAEAIRLFPFSTVEIAEGIDREEFGSCPAWANYQSPEEINRDRWVEQQLQINYGGIRQ